MKRRLFVAAFVTIGMMMAGDLWGKAPDVGDEAPEFLMKGSDGRSYDLATFRGTRAVVIAWYPKSFTGG